MRRDVVVTGVGAVTPLGVGARPLYELWRAGRSGIEGGIAACSEFDPTDHLSIKEARRADRFTQLALVASDEALQDAGWDGEAPYAPGRIGCVMGTGIGGLGTLETGKEVLMEHGPGKVSPLAVPLMMGNAAPAAVSMRHNLRGHSYAVLSACAAGAHAVGNAVRMIQSGDADAVIAGGAEAALTPLSAAAFGALDAMSNTGISCPFDARRDGFVMGEGAGVLVLEDGESARARGATILGTIIGYGATSDAYHLTAPDKDGQGASNAMLAALADAGIGPEDIVYINAHGTSTPLNDKSETMAIKRAFGDAAGSVPVSSLKSATGHLLGAAGAVEALVTLLAMRDRIAPPTLNYEQPDEGLDLDYVPNEARTLDIDGRRAIAMSNSFGFGGHNAVLCLEAA
ncbi:MAG: 3-oxoacyl-[acyl-carrier-protein] synthase [Solirubrobacteraceae bacterium]|jgi:3-oxoacyl-[acyl-carrier-protein] synthase II|nr:3-oxoacyl-[acyl-carrier-protein] synthase [Solirubrobacteraceae bacterium]